LVEQATDYLWGGRIGSEEESSAFLLGLVCLRTSGSPVILRACRYKQELGIFCPFLPPQPGKKQLPDVQLLAQQLLLRREFIPAPQGTNILFAFFAQHFTHQFFKTSGKMGPGFTKALGHGVSMWDREGVSGATCRLSSESM
jgi:hypothetical protein